MNAVHDPTPAPRLQLPVANGPLAGRRIDQIGLLTDDLDAAVVQWGSAFGLAPWSLYTYGPDTTRSLSYRGRPARFSLRLALSSSTPQIELIEPLAGPSIYHDWVAQRGTGLHHIGLFVDSIDALIPAMLEAGHELLQAGSGYGAEGDGGFAYFDTLESIGLITELIEVPRRRRVPEAVATPAQGTA